jgi:DNA modification methylase
VAGGKKKVCRQINLNATKYVLKNTNIISISIDIYPRYMNNLIKRVNPLHSRMHVAISTDSHVLK